MKLYYTVKKVKPVDGYMLLLTFSNGEKRKFDMKPYLNKGIFRQLKEVSMFNTVHVSFDTIEWDNDADFDPEVLYKLSKKIKDYKYKSPSRSIASAAEARPKYRKK